MKASTYIIDHYRLALLNDSFLTTLLSSMYLLGPLTEEDLASRFPENVVKLRAALDRLHSARFAMRSNELWRITYFGQDVLDRAGVSLAVTSSFFSRNARTEVTKRVLNIYCEQQALDRTELPRGPLAQINALALFLKRFRSQQEIVHDRYYWAAVWTNERRLDYIATSKLIKELFESAADDNVDRLSKKRNRAQLVLATKYLSQAHADIKRSNALLWSGEHAIDADQREREFDSIMLWSRFMRAYISRAPDREFALAARRQPEKTEMLWGRLRYWQPSIASLTSEVFADLRLKEPRMGEAGALLFQNESEVDEPIAPSSAGWANEGTQGSGTEPSQVAAKDSTETQLSRLLDLVEEQLNRAEVEDIPIDALLRDRLSKLARRIGR